MAKKTRKFQKILEDDVDTYAEASIHCAHCNKEILVDDYDIDECVEAVLKKARQRGWGYGKTKSGDRGPFCKQCLEQHAQPCFEEDD